MSEFYIQKDLARKGLNDCLDIMFNLTSLLDSPEERVILLCNISGLILSSVSAAVAAAGVNDEDVIGTYRRYIEALIENTRKIARDGEREVPEVQRMFKDRIEGRELKAPDGWIQ